MKEALLYKKCDNKAVKCTLCNHRCLIQSSKRGICGVRENHNGVLHTLVYGKAICKAVDPVEKKPLFHFLPGTNTLSIATLGCNFRCDNCQNWQISQGSKGNAVIDGINLLPEKVIEDAQKNQCPSISYTYTEPTIYFEYALDCMKLAKRKGLKNIFVSNGYMTEEMLKMCDGYLDAINVDLKFFDDKIYLKNCGAHLQPILDSLKIIKKMGIWIEVTTLAIPTLSDSDEMFKKMADFLVNNLGPETPWHISKFSGSISYKLGNIKDTPLSTLKKAYKIGKEAGLQYIYLGNVPGVSEENTYCPKCHELVIQRQGYDIKKLINSDRCPNGHQIKLILN